MVKITFTIFIEIVLVMREENIIFVFVLVLSVTEEGFLAKILLII